MIIIGVVALLMCAALGGLYRFNKEVLYVYEGEEQRPNVGRTSIKLAPAIGTQLTRPATRAGPIPSFAFRTISDEDLSHQFRQVEDRRRGLNEIAALGLATSSASPGGKTK